ncbi:conserved hypothetical protein [Echinococcus multilocularis]|uniref:Uncharacterized protein n=1 Tax=Echinococcus multilocularis TaxID=6211 RepID=A0A068YFK1_ECHMU|nr:conserved hypothetical protein [Echinococcus multilocularis]
MTSSVPIANNNNYTSSAPVEDMTNVSETLHCPQRKTPPHAISFSRDDLLKIKESKKSQQELDEKFILTNSKVLFKILKPECKVLERQSKSHDHNGIILGPQKRSWNAGCHVSQTKRSSQDSSFCKGQRNFQENRFFRGDFKRDFKGSERNPGRSNTTSGSGFTRGAAYGKESATPKTHPLESLKEIEKEPEWFTEGPETINDTVELGLVIEDGDIKTDKPPEDREPDGSQLNPSEVDSAILSLDRDNLPSHLSTISPNLNEADFLKFLDLPKNDSVGSQLSHFLAGPNSNVSTASTISGNHVSGNKSSSRLLKLIASSNDVPAPRDQTPLVPSSQPSTAELESVLRALVIGNSTTFKSLEVPNVSSKSSLLTYVPTVEEIEAAAFYGNGRIAPKPTLTQSSVLLDQLMRPWSLKQQSRPVSSSFGDLMYPTPSGRDLLGQRESSLSDTGSPLPPGLEIHPERKVTNWNGPFFGDTLIGPSGGPSSSPRGPTQFLNRQVNASSRLLPNDPAIAFQYTQRRPLVKGLSVVDPTMSQSQQRSYPIHQSPYFSPNFHPGMPSSAFHSSPSMEATLLQLKGSAVAHQNPITPPNSLFASNATIGGGSSNRLEQLLLSASAAAASAVSPNALYPQPRLRQNGSAPNLLPPTWQAAAASPPSAVDLLRSTVAGASGIGGPLPSPGLELANLYRKGS